MRYAVTIGKNEQVDLAAVAQTWATELEVPYLSRRRGRLDELLQKENLDGLIVATALGPRAYSAGGTLFFHPGMGRLRCDNIKNGLGDRMITAMQLANGMSVLDCTLGLAADAFVAAYVTGEDGKVVGLETSAPVAFVIREGLKCYQDDEDEYSAASRRITVINKEAGEYLFSLPDDCFDVVYFDPMFARGVPESSGMQPLRPFSCTMPLEAKILREAERVARKRVVIKSDKYYRPSFLVNAKEAPGGKYSRVKYSVIEVGK